MHYLCVCVCVLGEEVCWLVLQFGYNNKLVFKNLVHLFKGDMNQSTM